jgi:hypothetical protein
MQKSQGLRHARPVCLIELSADDLRSLSDVGDEIGEKRAE